MEFQLNYFKSKNDAVNVLHSICQQIWKTQQWPQDWKRLVFIPIPKKGNAKECSNCYTIALISHASKVILKILQARLQQYVNQELPYVQAEFRKGRGTKDKTANICWIIEEARNSKKIYFCFIDSAKAFDCGNKRWKILKELGIPDHLTCLPRNLYAGQEAIVRTRHGKMDWFKIGKGVCQDCILSPCLFNFYAELLFSRLVVSNYLWPRGLQHARLPCPSSSPGAYSNSCPLSQWCQPTISSSLVPFSSCPQSFPASGSFPVSLLFASDNQSIGVLVSVLWMNIWSWFPLRLTGLISFLSKEPSRVFSSTTVWKHQFFSTQPSLWSNSHICTWLLEKP